MYTTGERVRAARTKRGLTQGELGSAVGITHTSIAAIETGRTKPKETLELIAKELSVPLNWLIDGEGETPMGIVMKPKPILETNVWKDALVSELKSENERLWQIVMKLTGTAQVANFPTLIKQMPAFSPMRIAA